MKSVFFITKDVMHRNYIEPYSDLLWKTPNIAEIARKGTVFRKHYTAAPSTNMAVGCMFTGVYPYQNGLKYFVPAEPYEGTTLFDIMHERGYNCHVIWASIDIYEYANCFKEFVKIHNFKRRQSVGPHNKAGDEILNNDEELQKSTDAIIKCIDDCLKEEPVFIWMHVPHVIKGRNGYGADIDWFDDLIGMIRQRFDDDSIFISADHAHMNLTKGKCCYGFDVYEDAAHIPLVGPKISGLNEIDFPTDSTQLTEIIADRKVTRRPYVLSDTAYWGQPQRKLAIISGDYKYIFNRKKHYEELYDLKYDPHEEVNLAKDIVFDKDRKMEYVRKQIYYYPCEKEAKEALTQFRVYKSEIWKETSNLDYLFQVSKKWIRDIYKNQIARAYYARKKKKKMERLFSNK